MTKSGLGYDAAGVETLQVHGGLRELAEWVSKTFEFNAARPQLPLGYYANVLPLTPEIGLAISTDGVGTKLLIAQEMEQYDTVGIDCVAMNVNDLLCVGARPISLVDYIAVQQANPNFLGELAKGFYEGACRAGINIPGGEVAQVREMLHGARNGYAFDLVGTSVGIVHPQHVLIGQDVRAGDAIVGIASSGIHSNGFTLARRVLFEQAKLRATDHVASLGRSVGAELLIPTHIYVREVLQMLDEQLAIRAMMHITGDGFLNLPRVAAPVGFVIERLLDVPPIFALIQARGGLDDAEMFRVFNMGVGFCIVVDPADAARVVAVATAHGKAAAIIGYTVADTARTVWVTPKQLVSRDDRFVQSREPVPPRHR